MNPGCSYQIKILKRARKAFAGLSPQLQKRMMETIDELATNPRPPGSLKMSGVDSWRVRVGDYRILYDIEDAALVVLVVNLGHRREIYR